MTAAAASWLAAAAIALLIAGLAPRRGADVLSAIAPARTRRRSVQAALTVAGGWPIVRRVRVSASTRRRSDALAWDPRSVAAAKALLGAGCGLIGARIGGAFPAALCGLVGWRLPDVWAARQARARERAIDRGIPVMLDLLTVATSAGLPPQLALRRAVDAASGPLADELGAVVNATDLGGRWREELAAVSDRLKLSDLSRLSNTLRRSDALGSSLEEEIARLAIDVREARRAAATERARTAPVKMLFPLVLLILPSFLLLTVVPVLVTIVRSIA